MPAQPTRLARRMFASGATLALLATGGWFWFGSGTRPAPGTAPQRTCAPPAQAPSSPQPGMVWVPGGSFEFGDTLYPEEQPVRRVSVDGFWIDRTEVTNAQFAAFVSATGYVTTAEREVDARLHPGLPPALQKPGAVVFVMPGTVNRQGDITQWWRYVAGANWRHPGGPQTSIAGREAYPVVAVTYADAQAYAHWKGRILPSEAQWEWAARAGSVAVAGDRTQPQDANTWQGLFPAMNSGDDGFTGVAPVGCYAPSAFGLYDMIGNVWELTTDAYTPSHADPTPRTSSRDAHTARPAAGGQRVIKGGSYLCAPSYCLRYRAGSRQAQDDDLGASHVGFRTVLEATGR